jgi:ABC-type antimicrobial peptide transport system permease subunit
MFDLIKVAVRNVGRNTRRALITIITVFIGVFVVVGIRGLLDGLQNEIKSGLTRKMHGDIQIHRLFRIVNSCCSDLTNQNSISRLLRYSIYYTFR